MKGRFITGIHGKITQVLKGFFRRIILLIFGGLPRHLICKIKYCCCFFLVEKVRFWEGSGGGASGRSSKAAQLVRKSRSTGFTQHFMTDAPSPSAHGNEESSQAFAASLARTDPLSPTDPPLCLSPNHLAGTQTPALPFPTDRRGLPTTSRVFSWAEQHRRLQNVSTANPSG